MTNSEVRAVLFDLDDTLYPERDFFVSGFSSVARELESRGVEESNKIVEMLLSIHFNEGREGVFQKASRKLRFPEIWITELVRIFREHTPNVSLSQQTAQALMKLRREYLLGCVTDGWADVQRRKIGALGIAKYLDAIVIADDFGRAFWKPHPRPLLACCEKLNVTVNEAVFVGDNPERDIAAAENVAMRSILIRRPDGYFASSPLDNSLAHLIGEITTLFELPRILANKPSVINKKAQWM